MPMLRGRNYDPLPGEGVPRGTPVDIEELVDIRLCTSLLSGEDNALTRDDYSLS